MARGIDAKSANYLVSRNSSKVGFEPNVFILNLFKFD